MNQLSAQLLAMLLFACLAAAEPTGSVRPDKALELAGGADVNEEDSEDDYKSTYLESRPCTDISYRISDEAAHRNSQRAKCLECCLNEHGYKFAYFMLRSRRHCMCASNFQETITGRFYQVRE